MLVNQIEFLQRLHDRLLGRLFVSRSFLNLGCPHVFSQHRAVISLIHCLLISCKEICHISFNFCISHGRNDIAVFNRLLSAACHCSCCHSGSQKDYCQTLFHTVKSLLRISNYPIISGFSWTINVFISFNRFFTTSRISGAFSFRFRFFCS